MIDYTKLQEDIDKKDFSAFSSSKSTDSNNRADLPKNFKIMSFEEFLDFLTEGFESDTPSDEINKEEEKIDPEQEKDLDSEEMSIEELIDELNTDLKNVVDIVCDLLLHVLKK